MKTSTSVVTARSYSLYSGSTLDDKEITKWPMFKRSRDGGMGYLAQEQSVFRKLTVQQNLLAMGFKL